MTHVFATRRLGLFRLARIRAVRMLACLLAISLAFGGYLAAAAPLHASMAGASTAAGESCGHESMAMPAKHAPASDTCCRVSCACAFVHAIGDIAPI
ncbi:MAG: hypothetical protein ACTHK2_09395, partial [Dokdonella sp.]|uniref:hypothetical protein n=1 Tax=Dokdonella sp. TaxID=2291710 RepID=UPI003F8117FD